MSDTDRNKVDLSDRKRVGAEDESREQQFEAERPDGRTGTASTPAKHEGAEDAHDLAHSNDLTMP